MEGYFVRTLGMHRVYNSAFMHMLRDEDNAGYRRVIKETLEFDPEILKRYVNFMNNPDEKTAVEQFGKGDKYFGVATLMATLPGLPMLGHGQIEGFTEKYGMEFRRARLRRAARRVAGRAPRARDRAAAAPARLLRRGRATSCSTTSSATTARRRGRVRLLERQRAERGRWSSTTTSTPTTSGWIRESAAFAVKDATGRSASCSGRSPTDWACPRIRAPWLAFRDARAGLEYLRAVGDLRDRGLHLALHAYETHVFGEFRELADPAGVWRRLADRLGERGVPSLDEALLE